MRTNECLAWRSIGWLAVAIGVAACAGTPPGDPEALLTLAEDRLAHDEPEAAVDLLEAIDSEQLAGENLERYDTRYAQALYRSEELWDAYKVIREFSDRHAFSGFLADMQDLEFEIGSRLIQSPWRFLFFASDTDDGQVVLEHFIQRFPRHPSAPDALQLLGEKAFAEGQWILARERFREIALRHSDSEWGTLASFRIAMSAFRQLTGPTYDLQAMLEAHNELRDFLALRVESPQFEREARAALETTREWLAHKHVGIADFYRRLENSLGERHHLEAAARDYPETASGIEAIRRDAILDAAGQRP